MLVDQTFCDEEKSAVLNPLCNFCVVMQAVKQRCTVGLGSVL